MAKGKFTSPLKSAPSDADALRVAEPVDLDAPPRLPFPVVGLGASAGGLEALIEFFEAMNSDSGLAFVVVQHLPPDRDSLLVEIISKHTRMPVAEVTDGLPVEINHVYVIRPGRTLTLCDGRLHLGEPLERRGHQRPVDDLFRSLAAEQRERAICIVLSGMGSNGTAGAQAVKAVGGLCIAQDPASAKFPSMPRNLLDAGYADFVLRAAEMPATLLRYSTHPYAQRRGLIDDTSDARDRQALAEILAILRTRVRHDFSGYKKPTLLRRVQRRMGLGQVTALPDYARLLRQNPAEASALSDDLMIHVTGFFRDADAWQALSEKFIAPLVAERADGGSIRAWVTACSSGEEAYTLGLLLLEALEAAGKRMDIKIFATDTAERTLNHARNGIYPNGIESEISPERLERFFDRDDAVYRVKKELRELVVFAPQNVLQDPPFSRLDLCTCRNLLIYLEPEIQRRALALMHFGLRDGGVLFLGTSETIAGAEDLFHPLDKKHRLYRRLGPTRHGALDFPLPHTSTGAGEADARVARLTPRASLAQLANKVLLDRYSPATVVIDRQEHIAYFHGDTATFLDQPRGEPTRELLALVREPFRAAVRSAVHRALAEGIPVSVRAGTAQTPRGACRVEISVSPLEPQGPASHFVVSFIERAEAATPAPTDPNSTAESNTLLHEELGRVRDELQSTIEELQTSNEEMKASNEEVTSINEELQSTNEELETSKEELQSLNEELTTVNTQLQAKMEELEAATNDLSSLLSSTNIAVVFLDVHFRIRRFTPAVKDLLDLIPSDLGRPLSDLARKFRDDTLLPDAATVLDSLVPLEKEISSDSGRAYVRRVLPYRTGDNRIEGVVITFIDITDRQAAESALRESEERHRVILEAISEYAIFMVDVDGRIATWNSGAQRMLGYEPAEIIGQPLALLYPPEDRAARLPETELEQALADKRTVVECWQLRKNGTRFWTNSLLSLLPVAGAVRGFVKVLRDNTERKLGEEALKNAKRNAEAASEAKDLFLANVSHELRTPLSAMVLWTSLIEDQKIVDPAQLAEALGAIKRSAEEQRQLIEDLVDTSRIVAGKLRLELKDIHLATVIQSGLEAIRPLAVEKGVALESSLDPAADAVQADGARLKQVVANLVTNAVKYTPSGGRVSVKLQRFENNVHLTVADTGEGISPEFLPHLFDRFTQDKRIGKRPDKGLGLGLAIAKQIVELHGGSITVESGGLGHGSTFMVKLPLRELAWRPETAVVPGDKSQLSGILAGRRVLLIEDVAATRRALTAVLREAGGTVDAVDSAPAAWEALERARPDIIVSDLGLPTIDGYTLIRQIRHAEAEARASAVPAIALTAFAGEGVSHKAIEAGFQSCLTKPIEPLRLATVLASLAPARQPA